MNHVSLNTSALFGICMCCGSTIYGLTVTSASTAIPRPAIIDLESIWSFSWCIERLMVGSQKEYLGWYMLEIE